MYAVVARSQLIDAGRLRLKLKCSRQFPCTSCVKKGCAQICPDGSLTTGKGNRFVLANTEVLHEKITTLSNRVRQLEDALQETYSQISLEQHPLLSDDLLQIKRPLERETPEELSQEPEADTTDAIDAIGSLRISNSGHTNFFGTTANAWYLLQNEEEDEEAVESQQGVLHADEPWLSSTFLFSSGVAADTTINIRQSLIGHLPGLTEARRLIELYFRHAAWMYTPVPETEFHTSIMPRFYEQSSFVDQDSMESHKLAIVYFVSALGSLLDLDKPSYDTLEATRFYQLGRIALSQHSILEHQTIPAIQALILMCHFMFLSHIEGPRWALMGLAVKLAMTLGLHRDGNKWNMDPDEAFKRRMLFYELLTYDSWQSLTFGRPPSLSMAFVDCQIPESVITKTDQGEPEMSFSAWKHRFVSRCQSIVHEQAFGARVTSYRTILELDKKVREFYLPPSLRIPGFGGSKGGPQTAQPLELTMQAHCAFSIREITIFYMHRGFFASALQENPEDPLGSRYAQSVLAAYNSACAYVGLTKSLHSRLPALMERMWFYFTHVFSCAIVLGAIASKSPSIPLARSALVNLDSACSLFEDMKHNPRAQKVLPVLRKLKSRAEASMAEYHSRASVSRNIPQTVVKDDEEFAALGGKTRLVSRKSPSLPSPTISHGSRSQGSLSPRDLSDQSSPQSVVPPASGPLHHPNIEVPATWQHGYAHSPEMYGYPSYAPFASSAQYWQPDIGQVGMQQSLDQHDMNQQIMGMDVSAIQHAAYAHVDPMAAQYMGTYTSEGGSPVGQMQQHDTQWHNLWAQFNQP
ncbi:uncharacterized protein FIBRA_02410 [Fibroporia radiculosa]|uniref:Xylanolytic transcriptional activator regulatory domain-containing protein n=1 Tax=Fibroporia radiculosa TaxID=599839 RepID=J4GMV3_9APHY|nr:uncharacterized protein FIBRA_02410 [Fibroporia radiculosa]CCM00380.1 predicted protein [Fibroporia radiculosa]